MIQYNMIRKYREDPPVTTSRKNRRGTENHQDIIFRGS